MAPTGFFRSVALQPFLQVFRSHIHGVVEVPIWSVEGLVGGIEDLLDDIFLTFDHSGGAKGEAVYYYQPKLRGSVSAMWTYNVEMLNVYVTKSEV